MPQPQEDLVWGLEILKDSPINSWEKSTSDPLSFSKELLSTTILLCFKSSWSKFFSKVKSYLKPEQPPPFTAILKKVPVGFVDINWFILSIAF